MATDANLFDWTARARGNMSSRGLYIFRHQSKLGNAPAQALFESIQIQLKDGVESPRSFSDYVVTLPVQDSLPAGVTLINGLA